MKHSQKKQAKFYRSLVATAFLTSSFFPLALPVLAQLTTGGTSISNTATATYEDPDGETINSTSNTVVVNVAEVAGVTVAETGVDNDSNPGEAPAPNDDLFYNYEVTNVGNDPTRFRIPDGANVGITGPGTVGTVEISYDGGTTWVPVPNDSFFTDSVPAGDSILVRVPVTVDAGATEGDIISVELGDTPGNDQNVLRANNAGDVYTEDNADGAVANEVNGVPVNGVREASASQTATVSDVPSVLNGPENEPEAVGPTDNNDDFTNKSAPIPPGLAPGDTLDPDAVTFDSTVENNGNSPADISLVPTPPAIPGDLPPGTEVTITANGETRTYEWNGTEFTIGGTPIDDPTDYITIPNVGVGTPVNYVVEVDLPAGTELSTDIDRGFPVPITAFVDDATPGVQPGEPQNTTINRVYTGFLTLLKESRILQGTGPAVQGTDGTFSTGEKQPAPGNIIEYRITYTNISEPQAGSNTNVILPASNVQIVENGIANGNNWALDNDGNSVIDTSNVVGSATGTGTIEYFNGDPVTSGTDITGTTAATDVTQYINTVPSVQPTVNGTFIFRRTVN